jgi:hypothetical protein
MPNIPFVDFYNHLVTGINVGFKSEDNGIHFRTESLLKTHIETQIETQIEKQIET